MSTKYFSCGLLAHLWLIQKKHLHFSKWAFNTKVNHSIQNKLMFSSQISKLKSKYTVRLQHKISLFLLCALFLKILIIVVKTLWDLLLKKILSVLYAIVDYRYNIFEQISRGFLFFLRDFFKRPFSLFGVNRLGHLLYIRIWFKMCRNVFVCLCVHLLAQVYSNLLNLHNSTERASWTKNI